MNKLSTLQAAPFPLVPEELLDALDAIFPERCPDPAMDDRRIWMEVGKREVVRYLRAIHEEQSGNILETDRR